MPEPAVQLEVVRCTPDDLTPSTLAEAALLLQDLVRDGAALGWVDPPGSAEVGELLVEVAAGAATAEAALVLARRDGRLAGLGYWRRYARPTHRPHADLEKLAVGPGHQGLGVGRALMAELVASARESAVEVLTLDLRGDNVRAERLYASVGFARHGVLRRFVAVRGSRYDKVLMSLDLRH